MSTLVIGNSHVERLRNHYNFNGAKLLGINGMTSSQLRDNRNDMMLQEVILIMYGGNDVCDHPYNGRRAVANEIVM